MQIKRIIYFMCSASLLVGTSFADCDYYVKFEKSGEGYKVVQIDNSFIDDANVLRVTYYPETQRIGNAKIGSKATTCSVIYKNTKHKSYCSGDFVENTNTSKSVGQNVLFGALTLGAHSIATGGEYTTQEKRASIELAMKSSDFLTSDLTQPFIQQCTANYQNELILSKQRKIDQDAADKLNAKNAALQEKELQKQQEIAKRQQKEQEQKEFSYEQKFRASLKQGAETNCGTLIDSKGIMAHVQTGGDAGAIWIKKSLLAPVYDLAGLIIPCQDSNRIYKLKNGAWTLQK